MGENITKIKVGDDVRCVSLDTEVIDTQTFTRDSVGKLQVKLGSSMRADEGSNGIGVKIHPDTQIYLHPEHYGLSLKLDTIASAIFLALGTAFNFVIDAYNTINLDTGSSPRPLLLGTGLKGVDDGHTLCLSLGSGLMFDPHENKFLLKVNETQRLLALLPDGILSFNLDRLYEFLEARYNLEKK